MTAEVSPGAEDWPEHFSVLLGDRFGAGTEGPDFSLWSLAGSPLLHAAEGPTVATTRLLTLGAPVIGRRNALELLLPCCVPAVQWQREKEKQRGGRLSGCSDQSSGGWWGHGQQIPRA